MGEARDLPIKIEVTPQGLHVSVEFLGKLEQIPAALDRLKELGVFELVSAAQPAPAPSQAARPKAQRVQPHYNGDGEPMCPEHNRALKLGKWGLFCSAKNHAGEYCRLKFQES